MLRSQTLPTRPARRASRRGIVPVVLALLVVAGCSSPPVSSEELPEHAGDPVADPVVEVDDNVFRPDTVTVVTGTEVRWEWVGRIAHNVVGDGFDSGVIVTGEFTHTFDAVGTHPYVCTLHPGMDGEILVLPAS